MISDVLYDITEGVNDIVEGVYDIAVGVYDIADALILLFIFQQFFYKFNFVYFNILKVSKEKNF